MDSGFGSVTIRSDDHVGDLDGEGEKGEAEGDGDRDSPRESSVAPAASSSASRSASPVTQLYFIPEWPTICPKPMNARIMSAYVSHGLTPVMYDATQHKSIAHTTGSNRTLIYSSDSPSLVESKA